MNIAIDLTDLIVAAFTVIFGLIARDLKPFLKAKVDEWKDKIEDKKLEKIEFWVGRAVEAAEQIFKESGMGKEKKAHVVAFLESKGFTVDEVSIDTLIESAVLELKKDSVN